MKLLYKIVSAFLFIPFLLNAAPLDKAITNIRRQVLDYPQEKVFLDFDRASYSAGDTIWFRAHTVTEAFHLPSAMSRCMYIRLYGPDGAVLQKFAIVPMDKRLYSSFLVLPDYLPEGNYIVEAYTEKMQWKRKNSYYRKKMYIKNPVRKYKDTSAKTDIGKMKVDFYPEGGKLIAGQETKVAFTAEKNGKPCAVEGEVHEAGGKCVAKFGTMQPGIGVFSFTPNVNTTYYALVSSNKGKKEIYDFPYVYGEGVALSLSDLGDSWYISLKKAGVNSFDTNYNVVMLLRGVPQFRFKFDSNKDFVYLPKNMFDTGIYDIVLLDQNNEVKSQRLLFSRLKDQAVVKTGIKVDSTKEKPEVEIVLSINDPEGAPLDADYSVAIIPDDKNKESKNIYSEFLFSSDINIKPYDDFELLNNYNQLNSSIVNAYLIASRWPKFDVQRAVDGTLDYSWDIGSAPDEIFPSSNSDVYAPLSKEELAVKDQILKNVQLKTVNVSPRQVEKRIKPYPYANNSIPGKDIVEQGVSLNDYLVNVAGLSEDYDTKVLYIRNGSVTYLLDGFMVDADRVNSIPTSEIESVDILKDAGNLGFFKFMKQDSASTAVGGVVAVWTTSARDVKPSKKAGRYRRKSFISDEVRRISLPGTEDVWQSQFPNISRKNLWKPCVLTDKKGESAIRFAPGKYKHFILKINGVSFDGKIVYGEKEINL